MVCQISPLFDVLVLAAMSKVSPNAFWPDSSPWARRFALRLDHFADERDRVGVQAGDRSPVEWITAEQDRFAEAQVVDPAERARCAPSSRGSRSCRRTRTRRAMPKVGLDRLDEVRQFTHVCVGRLDAVATGQICPDASEAQRRLPEDVADGGMRARSAMTPSRRSPSSTMIITSWTRPHTLAAVPSAVRTSGSLLTLVVFERTTRSIWLGIGERISNIGRPMWAWRIRSMFSMRESPSCDHPAATERACELGFAEQRLGHAP